MCFRSPLVHSTCQCDSWCDRHSFLSEFWLNPSEPQRQGMQKSVSNSAHIPTVELKKKIIGSYPNGNEVKNYSRSPLFKRFGFRGLRSENYIPNFNKLPNRGRGMEELG
ncbi:hypothetical protein CEXT_363631 [Caerostris extrusa]|uniref:Uncharacterized protein n=1 Tax=Caerostris extrusa TaxID=172846 RepID=A0AAV4XHJ8_CAEEX|nr:hypothetical protein CEXT_363631 [Caerostris extrusa]